MLSCRFFLSVVAVLYSQLAWGQLAISGTVTNVSCANYYNGAINLNVTGGDEPYIYNWSNGQQTKNITGLWAGTYTVTVKDQQGSAASASFTVVQPDYLNTTGTVVHPSCTSSGSISLTTTGGLAPYQYQWNTGATAATISDLQPGAYWVNVTDANGCTTGTKFWLESTNPWFTVSQQDLDCSGNNAAISLNVYSGQPPYSYSWSNGATTKDATGLSPGTYSVTVTDAAGCTANASIKVGEPDPVRIKFLITPTTSCEASGANGEISVNIYGGKSPFSYRWSDGSTAPNRVGLPAGNYLLTLTDANGCSVSGQATVVEDVKRASITVVHTSPQTNCGGIANGSAKVIAISYEGAAASLRDFTFQWADANGNMIGTGTSGTGLTAGSYMVTATKLANPGAGCASDPFEVVVPFNPVHPTIALSSTPNTSCSADRFNGSASATIHSPTASYSWSWSRVGRGVLVSGNEGTSATIAGLGPGEYELDVISANGCSATATITITDEFAAYAIAFQKGDMQCVGEQNGWINVDAEADYDYHFFKEGLPLAASAEGSLAGLDAGTYTMKAVNKLTGCEYITAVAIAEPSSFAFAESIQQVSAYGASDGSIDLLVSGGVAPYGYLWSNGATSRMISGLSAQTYTVTVTDAQQCSQTLSFVIEEPLSLADGSYGGSLTLTRTAGGHLLVKFADVLHPQELKIYRLDGKLMASAELKGKDEAEVIMPAAAPALYLLVFTSKGSMLKKKIIF